MKKVMLLAATMMLLGCSENSVSKDTMVVKGNIEGLKKGKIFLQKFENGKIINLDSVQANGSGEFVFKRQLESPEVFYILLNLAENEATKSEANFGNRVLFFGEPNKVINIRSKHELFDVNVKIEGSESQKIYEKYTQNLRKFNVQNLDLLEKQINALKENNTTLSDSISKVSEKNTLRKYLYILNFAFTHPDSYVSPFVILADAPNAQLKYLDSVYKVLSPEVSASKYGKELKKYIEEIKTQPADNQ